MPVVGEEVEVDIAARMVGDDVPVELNPEARLARDRERPVGERGEARGGREHVALREVVEVPPAP